MSFSSQVKMELSQINNLAKKNQVDRELAGYLITGNAGKNNKKIKFSTESEYNINRFAKLLKNVNIEKYNIYKVSDKIINFNIIDEAIKTYLLRNEYNKNNVNITFNGFYINNESLITNEEISKIKDNIINKYPTLISKILNSDSIKVVLNKPKNITCEYIICDNKELQNLFLEISDKLID